ncbi:hypothetical protein ACRTDJ_09725 [Shewanella algae]
MMDKTKSGPRLLIAEEKQALRRDMQESSAWAKAELKRRRAAKNKNYAHGIYDVIESNLFLTAYYLSVFSYH